MSSRESSVVALVLLLACGAAIASDEVVPADGVLNLRTGDFRTNQAENLLNTREFPTGRCVMLLDGPMTPARRAGLAQAGVSPGAYLPRHAFVVDLAGVTPERIRALGFVRWVGAYRDEWKIDPALRKPGVWTTDERAEVEKAGRVIANLWLFDGCANERAVRELAAIEGAQVREAELVGKAWRLNAELPREAVARLAALADVQFVEQYPEYGLRSNSITRWVVQSNVANMTPLYDRGLIGTGQIVGIIDGRIGADHCSFLDPEHSIGPEHRKIIAYNTDPGYNFHGTHVAGTAVGDGGNTGNTRGVAYGARLVYNYYPDVGETSVYARHDLHATQGARVHNNSWGTDVTREYDGACRAIDLIQNLFEDNLIVQAVSNSTIVTNPENAKNSLAVAATSLPPNQGNWCGGGTGPTLDGRRKPEITAPGCSILSSSGASGCVTGSSSGTSMAAPAVSGVAALVREYYMSGFYPGGTSGGGAFEPSGQLIKATLVNSAADMPGPAGFPGTQEGWGRVLADDALYFAGDARRLVVQDVRNSSELAMDTGDVRVLRVSTGQGQVLKITLSWADAPAEVNASYAPVNDLNLVAIAPSGVVYRGNYFVQGRSGEGGVADAINNLEQVMINTPEAGDWEVRIEAAGVNVGRQGYALVVTGDVHESCDPDLNGDGVPDQGDVACLILAVAGDLSCIVQSPDFNRDGVPDQGDIGALILAIAGGGCP